MKTVTIHDAKTNLSKYIAAAKKGHKIYIGGFGKPEVVLYKIPSDLNYSTPHRNFTIAKGKIVEKTGAFSKQTDQKIASLMYGE